VICNVLKQTVVIEIVRVGDRRELYR